jgi:hypothetical protein
MMFASLARKVRKADTSALARSRKRRPSLESLEGRQLLSLGSEFGPINPVPTVPSNKYTPVNASSANGTSVVAWTESLSFTTYEIRAQVLNSSGQKVGPAVLVAGGTNIDNDQPAVAMDAHGDFVVAWRQTEFNGDTNVYAQRFNPNGLTLGGIVPVGAGTFKEHDPSVAMDARGDFVVAYTRDTNNGSLTPDVFAKLYDVSNNLVNVDAVAVTPATENHASVAMTPDGRFDVAWEVTSSPGNDDIDLSRYTASGGYLGTVPVAATSAFESLPSVSVDNSGNAEVAWQVGSGNSAFIEARRVSSTGLLGPVTGIAGGSAPSVALKPTGGGFVVAYNGISEFGDVKVTEVSANGAAVTFDAGQRDTPKVSINAADNYLLTYRFDDRAAFDVFGRLGHLS